MVISCMLLFVALSKMKRSNSLSDILADYVFTPQRDPAEVETEIHQLNSKSVLF